MVDPISGGIQGKGKVAYRVSVDFVIESEEDAEAGMCEKCVPVR
jgi:hypothetical protein